MLQVGATGIDEEEKEEESAIRSSIHPFTYP
jgi:hypothetical protein